MKRKIPFVAADHEISHGRDIRWSLWAKEVPEHIRKSCVGTGWIVEVDAVGTRDGKPFHAATHLFRTRPRTTPEALLNLVRDRWSIEGWQRILNTHLYEDAYRHQCNGTGAKATLRTTAPILLCLAGLQSFRAGLQAVMQDIMALIVLAMRQPEPNPC